MKRFDWILQAIEYLGGERDEAPAGFPIAVSNWWFWSAWWGVLAVLILIFSGQSSKFIYVDF
jgi:hypothetical protein